jgi:hypothetical protein
VLVIILLFGLQVAGVVADPAGESAEDRQARMRTLRQERMRNDMRYGTDSYFGSNRDVWYADMARPTPAPTPVAESTPVPKPEKSSSSSVAAAPSAPSSDSSSGSTSSPPPPPPPDAPPPPPPDVPPPPHPPGGT